MVDRTTALEEAALSALEQVEPFLILGDWLQSQGDPRGNLIAVQHRLLEAPEDPELLARERDLLDRHSALLLGAAHPFREALELTWRLGFITAAHLGPCEAPAEALQGLLQLRISQPLSQLTVELGTEEPEELSEPDLPEDLGLSWLMGGAVEEELPMLSLLPGRTVRFRYRPLLEVLQKTGAPALQSLHLGPTAAQFRAREQLPSALEDITLIPGLHEALPALRHLSLRAASVSMERVVPLLTQLESFELRAHLFDADEPEALLNARYEPMRDLRLDFGQLHTPEILARMLDRAHLPNLLHLAVERSAPGTEELLEEVVQGDLLEGLRSLDLRGGELSQRVVRFLLQHRKRLQHLERLNLSPQNPSMVDLGPLLDICPGVVIDQA